MDATLTARSIQNRVYEIRRKQTEAQSAATLIERYADDVFEYIGDPAFFDSRVAADAPLMIEAIDSLIADTIDVEECAFLGEVEARLLLEKDG